MHAKPMSRSLVFDGSLGIRLHTHDLFIDPENIWGPVIASTIGPIVVIMS